jgi:hypothetical protein
MVSKPPKIASRRLCQIGLVASALIIGCSSKPDLPPMAGGNLLTPAGSSSSTALQSCEEVGSTRSCSKTLERHGEILSCYHGTQTCIGGVWSDCLDGTVVLQSAPATSNGGERLLSISKSQACGDNPCDPTCQRYIEVPSTGLTAQAGGNTWQAGSVSSLPTDIQTLVSKPNCETAADCQANQHCVNVATNSTCALDKCQTGKSPAASCNDPCVASICAQNPGCCSSVPTCADGQILSPDGTRCYYYNDQSLPRDDARASCKSLGSQWDLICINTTDEQNFVGTRTTNASWSGMERVTYNDANSAFRCVDGGQPLANGLVQGQWPWNGGEPNYFRGAPENCVEVYAYGGLWNDDSCGYELPSWCEGPPIPSSGWTDTCADLVASVCGTTCDTTGTNPPATCQTWATGETNPNDNGPDLGVGVPCQGQIPVCNHGTAAAPAGAVVHVLPTTNLFGTPNVASDLGTCTTTTTIAPGACVMVGECASLLANDAELWVSYPTGTTSESRTDDNWGYNHPGVACGVPQCLAGLGPCFSSVTKTYDYLGECPEGDVPQWSFLTFESSAPGDSSIVFSVIAGSADQLASNPSVFLTTATHAAGNEQCDLTGPASKNCPVDLYRALSVSGAAQAPMLLLTVKLNPSSDGMQSPVLSSWRIAYSCPAGT